VDGDERITGDNSRGHEELIDLESHLAGHGKMALRRPRLPPRMDGQTEHIVDLGDALAVPAAGNWISEQIGVGLRLVSHAPARP
jgi:hypothetical protein